jgi:flavin-dependent dehydrogenase
MPKKIIIIGAGPIGCYTAQVLKNYGLNSRLIEEHGEVGRPLHCTGLVGRKLFEDKRRVPIPRSAIINMINGAIINYEGQSFSIKRKGVAYVVDRERFDKELSRGLEILYSRQFLGLEKSGPQYIIETDHGEFQADIVIGADGANSVLRAIVSGASQVEQCRGVQMRMRLKPKYKDVVEVFLNKTSFVWIVPEANDIVRIGTISENPYSDLQFFLKDRKIKGEIVEKFGGLVITGVCDRTVKDNLALVGDAACQVKPLTYGGLYFGLKCSGMLAACIKNNRLKDYDQLWRKEIGSEISMGLKIRGVYNKLASQELSAIFNLLKDNKSLIEKFADFENHSRLLVEVAKKPSLYPRIGSLFRILFKAIF